VTYFEHQFRLKLQGVTRFCGQGILSVAKYRQLGAVQGEAVISEQLIFKWHRTFASGRNNMMDENRSGLRSSFKQNSTLHAPVNSLTWTDMLTPRRKIFDLRLFPVTAQYVVLNVLQNSKVSTATVSRVSAGYKEAARKMVV